jgi:uncharacterized protein (TIGR03437 family)
VVSAGSVVSMPGVQMVSVVVPDGVAGDAVPLVVVAAGEPSPPVTMCVR